MLRDWILDANNENTNPISETIDESAIESYTVNILGDIM